LKEANEKVDELEAKVLEANNDVADKEYEVEFYRKQFEELKSETEGPKGGAGELDTWKKKCKVLMQREVELLDEIEKMKGAKELEEREKAVGSLKQRASSRGREERKQ